MTRFLVFGIALCLLVAAQTTPAAADTFFPNGAFGVAGPIPTPGNINDLVGAPSPSTAVRFDPGDLGFLRFDVDISGISTNVSNLSLLFNIASAVPASSTGDVYLSVLLGNIAPNAGGVLTFTRAATADFTTPNGASSIFEFTQISPGASTFELRTDSFVSGCLAIGGCNSIVIGTSGLGAAGGGAFIDGGTVTFSSIIARSPEPAVWAMMIVGFGLVAGQMKRHRRGMHSYWPTASVVPDWNARSRPTVQAL